MVDIEPFKREERYIVIKRKHLSVVQETALRAHMARLEIGTVECVVVESDWPEYETVWDMIKARVTGHIAGEPPHDGKEYQVTLSFPMRWKAYKPSSEQFRHGVKGRWQKMNEYGGWDNADGAGRHWPFVSYVDPQALSHAPEGQPGDGK